MFCLPQRPTNTTEAEVEHSLMLHQCWQVRWCLPKGSKTLAYSCSCLWVGVPPRKGKAGGWFTTFYYCRTGVESQLSILPWALLILPEVGKSAEWQLALPQGVETQQLTGPSNSGCRAWGRKWSTDLIPTSLFSVGAVWRWRLSSFLGPTDLGVGRERGRNQLHGCDKPAPAASPY